MALYYDAVTVLTGESQSGSLKSTIYGGASELKSKPAQVYALITECAKYDAFLKEVVDNAGLLAQEPKLSPLLSLLLVHDHFFSKGGIAASVNHVSRQSIERHKARLRAEFTKARLRRNCGSIEILKETLAEEKAGLGTRAQEQPRWVRLNRLRAENDRVLENAFNDHSTVADLSEIVQARPNSKVCWHDRNIPDLLALPPGTNLNRHRAYADGGLILQDKASCFPAHLLLGDARAENDGDVLDACAAPGNKTTHLAAILAATATTDHVKAGKRKLFACERDPVRSKTLQMMVSKAGAANVLVLANQDFLALEPSAPKFANVTHLLLDPSCSGSGIVGREDIPVLALPESPPRKTIKASDQNRANGKKRKRGPGDFSAEKDVGSSPAGDAEYTSPKIHTARLEKLSNLQSHIIEHAFTFPAATRTTYSTCSVHAEENENVVARVLQSPVALRRGWRLLPRRRQVSGLAEWKHRGLKQSSVATANAVRTLTDEELDACIHCYPNDDERTMGFFVCCFVRDDSSSGDRDLTVTEPIANNSTKVVDGENEDDSWSGFED